jgi:ribosomal protein L37AE/L43A
MKKLTSEADVNHRLPIIELVKHYQIKGLTVYGSTLCHGICPFCGKAKLQIMPTQGLWLCFDCRKAGRTFDLAVELEGVARADVLDRINSWICGESTIGYMVCF